MEMHCSAQGPTQALLRNKVNSLAKSMLRSPFEQFQIIPLLSYPLEQFQIIPLFSFLFSFLFSTNHNIGVLFSQYMLPYQWNTMNMIMLIIAIAMFVMLLMLNIKVKKKIKKKIKKVLKKGLLKLNGVVLFLFLFSV